MVTAADTGKPVPGVFLDVQAGALSAFHGEARTDEAAARLEVESSGPISP